MFVELPGDLDTPLSAYLRLRPGPYSFLLESVEGGEKWARYSFLGTDPMMVLSAKNGRITLRRAGGRVIERLPDGNPLDALRTLLAEFQPVPVPGLPRFQGGTVGYLAYDMVHFALHHTHPQNRLGKRLRELHMRHHFEDDESGFGVSAPWWDYVFGTSYASEGAKAERRQPEACE